MFYDAGSKSLIKYNLWIIVETLAIVEVFERVKHQIIQWHINSVLLPNPPGLKHTDMESVLIFL